MKSLRYVIFSIFYYIGSPWLPAKNEEELEEFKINAGYYDTY